MKFCMHCGKEIKESVKFCPFCGGKQQEIPNTEEKISVEATNNVNEPVTKSADEETVSFTPNQEQTEQQQDQQQTQGTPLISINQETVNQLTDRSKNYLSYLNQNIKSPALGKANTNGVFGLTSYIVVNVLISLGISHALGKSFTGLNFQFKMFLPLLLLFLVGQFINVLAIFLLGSKVFKANISLMEAFDRVYAPISISVYGAVIMFIFTFVSRFGFSFIFTIVLLFIFFLIYISYIANIWSLDNFATNKNKFYWTIGALVLAFIIQIFANILLGDIVGGSLLSLFEEILTSVTSNMFF